MCIVIQRLPGLSVFICKINLIIGRIDGAVIADIFAAVVCIDGPLYRNGVSIAVIQRQISYGKNIRIFNAVGRIRTAGTRIASCCIC